MTLSCKGILDMHLLQLAAASVACVVTMAESSVAVALIVAVGEVGLVRRTGVEGTVVVVDTTGSGSVTTGAGHAVVVATARLAGHANELAATGSLAATNVHGVVTPAETHITTPHVAVGAGLLEASASVEVTVMVVQTTSSHDEATGETDIAHTDTTEAQGASGAGETTDVGLTGTIVAGKTARAETGVATEVVALGHGLLESTELVPGAVVVDHTTTEGNVATRGTGTDDTSAVGAGSASEAGKLGLLAVGSSHTRGEASLEETETALVGSRDTKVLAAGSDLVGVLAMTTSSDEALHHHLTEESLHAVASEALGRLEGASDLLLDGAAASITRTLGVADLHHEVLASGTEVGTGTHETTVRVVHTALGTLPLTGAVEGDAGTLTEGLEGEVPTDAGTTLMAEMVGGDVDLTGADVDGALGTVDEVLVAGSTVTTVVEAVEHALSVLDIAEDTVDGSISGLNASRAACLGGGLGLDAGAGLIEGGHHGALLDEGLLRHGGVDNGNSERKDSERFHHRFS